MDGSGQKKIPTLAGFFIIIILIIGISFGVELFTATQTKASGTIEPKNVTVTNMTDTSFSIVWETADPATGFITATGTNGKKLTAFDERDVEGKMDTYTTHSITLRNLSPDTSYNVVLFSNGKTYQHDGKPFMVKTPLSITSYQDSMLEPSYGVVKNLDGTAALGTLIILSIESSQQLSALVKPSGSWIIPLNTIRTKDLTAYIPVKDRMTETITVSSGTKKIDIITDTLNDSPVPDVTFGEHTKYDFRGRDAKNKTTTTLAVNNASQKTDVLGDQTEVDSTPIKESTQETSSEIAIVVPEEESAIPSTKPLFQGKGIIGKTVNITLNGPSNSTGTTTVDAKGIWQFSPRDTLIPGSYTFTLTTTDETGKTVTKTTTFTVLKSGTQVLGDATPSAVLDATPSATPTAELTGEPMPEPGTTLPTVLLIMIGLVFLGGGVFIIMH